MGGVGSGGPRPGAGRKKKSDEARALDGNARQRARVLPHPSAGEAPAVTPTPLPVLTDADAPADFTPDERKAWLELAPFALQNRTLTPATALGFRMLCRNVALERMYSQSVTDRGGANHRGLIQRIDAELLRFNLAPCGKPLGVPGTGVGKPPADPLKAKYFGAGR